ncbi:hypothetical protein GDO86_015576 [Hymenochirus boettgeri]|uniref:Hexosyltransferase n=1 Tax=Hymenochirus boettgeri TaxID=247094 RepID=A0A8T2JYE8_9PIPI|nr:hypothetical protein GDO86_015576 [Hymenochirus boettgeri]
MISPFHVYLRCLHFSRRRWPILFLVISCLFFLHFIFSGYFEELLSCVLPLFYPTPSSLSTSQLLAPSILVSPPKGCSPAPFLLILVSSSPSHQDQRNTIRQTWGSRSSSKVSLSLTLFVLGVPKSENEQTALLQEANIYGDIIQADFTDSYRNLTLKTLVGLSFVSQRCQGAKFLMKTDDDVFVNTLALSRFLQGQGGPLYLGRVHWRVYADRNPGSRHYTSRSTYPDENFPPYCSGTGYVLSQEAIVSFLQQAERQTIISLEDVYSGILAWAAGISPKHVARFAGSILVPHSGCCYNTMFTSHGLTPQSMKEAWTMLSEVRNDWCLLSLLRCKIQGNIL